MKLRVVALAACVSAIGGMAHAAYVAPSTPLADFEANMDCDTTGVTSYDFCTGMVTDTGINPANNDSVAALNDNGFFGFNDWELLDKDDNPGTDFTGSTLTLNYDDMTSGDYSIDGTSASYALIIKASSGFSAYLLTSTAGDFSNGGLINNGGKVPDISHISLYGRGIGNTTVVPVPMPILLLTSAIGLVGFVGSRRKA